MTIKNSENKLEEGMFTPYSQFFKQKVPATHEDHTHEYRCEVSLWTYQPRGVTCTIYKGQKVVWEHKSNNPSTLQADEVKMFQMLRSLNLNTNTIDILKKINGRVVDEVGESVVVQEARRSGSFNAIAPAKRKGLTVGDTNQVGPNQVEVILPRDDLDKRKSLLKPLIDSGHKIQNTVRNGRMDIVTLKKPISEDVELDERVIDYRERRKRAMTMRKFKSKLKLARVRSEKRLADTGHLEARARKAAIMLIRRKFAGKMGAEYKSLSASQKIEVDKKIEPKKRLIAKIARRILPKIRAKEIARFRERNKNSSEQLASGTSS